MILMTIKVKTSKTSCVVCDLFLTPPCGTLLVTLLELCFG